MWDIEELIKEIKEYDDHADFVLIRKAYNYAKKIHIEQKRESGEEYIMHPLEVARILIEMRADTETICAALLHDVAETTKVDIEKIKTEFNQEIANLVEGVTKTIKIEFKSGEEYSAENIRKILLATTKDIRIILIKLADRLHNMRTLKFLREDKQKRIAKETVEIYAPIAYKLGIWEWKGELEDLALRYLEPEVYQDLKGKINRKREEREEKAREIIKQIDDQLRENNIDAKVFGRAKYFYSIFQKMKKDNKTFDEIYDLIGIRVIVKTIPECYAALAIIHHMWKPKPGRFKDYIAVPKSNGYQSLHTDVVTPLGEILEVQIRTQEMHYMAEQGVAAHWRYKGTERDKKFDQKIAWLKQILDWKQSSETAKEFIETLKIDLFEDEIVAFTPKGDPIIIPEGSSPIDFAYEVHTDIGNHCSKAEVNGSIVPLDYKLKSGDIIYIITQKNAKPSRNWLNFVVTTKAKTKIKQILGLSVERDPKQARVQHEQKDEERVYNLVSFLEYEGKAPLKISKCCNPQYEDEIAAFVMKDGTVSVHKKNCPNIATLTENKPVPIKWKSHDRSIKTIEILVKDKIGLIEQILNTFSELQINVLSINIKTSKENLLVSIKIKIDDQEQLNFAISKLKSIKNILEVKLKTKWFIFF
jgi:GTP diphosphokinase / guanosine-3',5'-bis(diphosphate) 3'-diphosphatase